MATPESVLAKIEAWEQNHLAKFQDISAFLSEQNEIVVDYFRKQTRFESIEEFRAHLKSEFERYKIILQTVRSEKQHDILEELIDNIAIPYAKLVYYGETIPSWAREMDDKADKKFPFMKLVRVVVNKILLKKNA